MKREAGHRADGSALPPRLSAKHSPASRRVRPIQAQYNGSPSSDTSTLIWVIPHILFSGLSGQPLPYAQHVCAPRRSFILSHYLGTSRGHDLWPHWTDNAGTGCVGYRHFCEWSFDDIVRDDTGSPSVHWTRSLQPGLHGPASHPQSCSCKSIYD